MKNPALRVIWWSACALTVAGVYYVILSHFLNVPEKRSAFGDAFGGLSCVVTVVAIFSLSKTLKDQREQQNEQRIQQQKDNERHEKSLELMQKQMHADNARHGERIDLMNQQIEVTTRPYVVAYLYTEKSPNTVPHHPKELYLIIENVGRSGARDMKVTLNTPFERLYEYGETAYRNALNYVCQLSDLDIFKSPLPYFAPEQKIPIWLGNLIAFTDPTHGRDLGRTPDMISLHVTYNGVRSNAHEPEYNEPFNLNLSVITNASPAQYI